MKDKLTEDLYEKQSSGCPAKTLTYLGWYCRGQFHKKCLPENCFVVKFAIETLEENK